MSRENRAESLHAEMSYAGVCLTHVGQSVDQSERPSGLFERSPAETLSYRVIKRSFDVVAALVLFPFVALVGLFVAFFLMLDCPGPVFFSHSRIKQGGRYFLIRKFRTMCPRAPEVLEQHFVLCPQDREEWRLNHKLKKDPRVSAYGAFLRRTSLDELPQIWNVLVGEMSFVGPRPIVHEEIDKYGADYASYASVKPGITGLWQTSGRSTLTYEERVALDRLYVENWSFRLDLRILLRTIRSVSTSDGAY